MIIDVILIVFVALGAYFGYKKGLINVLTSVIAILLSISLSFLLQIPVANTLRQSSIGNNLYIKVSDGINKARNDNKADIDNNSFYKTIVQGILSDEQVNEQSEKITMFILKGLSFVIIFLVVTIIVFVLRNILNIVFDLPILNSVNKFGGLALGGIKSLVVIYIILALIAFLSPIPSVSSNIIKSIDKTSITKVLYNNNMLVNIINKSIE